MSNLLSLSITLLAFSHTAVAATCYYDSFGYRRCNNTLPYGARIGLAIGLLALGFIILSLLLFQRRRRLANRNAILLQQQQAHPQPWGSPNGPSPFNAGTPYGPPYGQQPQYGGGYPTYPNNTGYPVNNTQPQPFQPGYTGVYAVTTPDVNVKGYEATSDKPPSNVQEPARSYDPSQPYGAPNVNVTGGGNNAVEHPASPPEYTGYQPPSGGPPPQMPTATGGSHNPEGYSNNPYVYNPPNTTKS